jgi:hypothetical protein
MSVGKLRDLHASDDRILLESWNLLLIENTSLKTDPYYESRKRKLKRIEKA